MKNSLLLFSALALILFSSCEPYVPETIDNLAAEFAETYSVTSLETHLGADEDAIGDKISVDAVNDSTLIIDIDFTSFNGGQSVRIEGLNLFQKGDFVNFNQDFDDVNISGGNFTDNVDSRLLRVNISYPNEQFIEMEAREVQ